MHARHQSAQRLQVLACHPGIAQRFQRRTPIVEIAAFPLHLYTRHARSGMRRQHEFARPGIMRFLHPAKYRQPHPGTARQAGTGCAVAKAVSIAKRRWRVGGSGGVHGVGAGSLVLAGGTGDAGGIARACARRLLPMRVAARMQARHHDWRPVRELLRGEKAERGWARRQCGQHRCTTPSNASTAGGPTGALLCLCTADAFDLRRRSSCLQRFGLLGHCLAPFVACAGGIAYALDTPRVQAVAGLLVLAEGVGCLDLQASGAARISSEGRGGGGGWVGSGVRSHRVVWAWVDALVRELVRYVQYYCNLYLNFRRLFEWLWYG